MIYQLPAEMKKKWKPDWEDGIGNIPAHLSDGSLIQVPVLDGVNALTLGTTGAGKTASFVLPAVKILLQDPRRKAVFFETKDDFIKHFLTPNDKVIVHSTSNIPANNIFLWNMPKEIQDSVDKEAEMEQIASFLFQPLLSEAQQNRAWIEAAKNTFVAVLRVLIDYSDPTDNWTLINALRRMNIKELLAYIARNPRNRSLLRNDFDYNPQDPEGYKPTKRASDIMFFFNNVLQLFSGTFESRGQDTIHDYLNGTYGRSLFILHDLKKAEVSRPFIGYFLKKIKDEKMSLSSSLKDEKLLLVMDEVDKLAERGKAIDFGLFQAATLGREYGIQILLATQSLENLYGLSEQFNEHITNGGLAGFPVMVVFKPGDPATISMLQTMFGSIRKEIVTLPLSRYDHAVIKSEREPMVTDAEFNSLKTGDCYIKMKHHNPQRVSFIYQGR